jgi:uncharacterized protein YodC (DUF2158 family)
MIEFKIQDNVQLLHGISPEMTIAEINEADQTAKCVWYDSKSREIKDRWIPLTTLKPTEKKAAINKEDLLNTIYRRNRY